jgi:hypothetical protein
MFLIPQLIEGDFRLHEGSKVLSFKRLEQVWRYRKIKKYQKYH